MRKVHNARPARPRKTALHARATPRKAPRQARSKHMVAMLMRATARVLIRHGYDALTTNLVAHEAGASVGSLYQYFSSKEALVAALLDDHMTTTMRALRQEAPRIMTLPVPLAARRFIELMVASHQVAPELHRVFAEQLPRVGDFARIEAQLEEAMVIVQTYLEAHRDEVVPEDHALSAFVLVSAVETLSHRAELMRNRKFSSAQMVAAMTQLVLGYLQPEAAVRSRRAPRKPRAAAARSRGG
ncbi:MAG: TetR/AcrR family transcriptional regulator [Polyangiales bacterium]